MPSCGKYRYNVLTWWTRTGKGGERIVAEYVCFASYERYDYLRLWTPRPYISGVIADSGLWHSRRCLLMRDYHARDRAVEVYIWRFKVGVRETAPWWRRQNVLGRQFWTVRPESHIPGKLSSFVKLSCVNSIIPEYLDNNVFSIFIKKISLSLSLFLFHI